MKQVRNIAAILVASFFVSYLFGAFYDGSFALTQDTRGSVIVASGFIFEIGLVCYAGYVDLNSK